MTHPSLIPWKSKEEWVAVYNNAYSGNYDEVFEAVKKLTIWRNYMEWGYRPGMDCTRGILLVTLKDKEIYPDTKCPAELYELRLMYSAEIMRFLNLINDNAGKKRNKKVSMYGKAKEIGIPDWVVNIRHKMAHGINLPFIDALRTAANFILKWLKHLKKLIMQWRDNKKEVQKHNERCLIIRSKKNIKLVKKIHYWEQEGNEMKEVIAENKEKVVKESLLALFNIYILLKEQNILGFKCIRDIQDPDVKDLIYMVNRFTMNEVTIRCRPWESNQGKSEISVNLQKLTEYSISRAVFYVLRLLKQFIYPKRIFGVNTINILVEKLIDDSVEHNGMRNYVWSTFLKAVHSWFLFPLVIKALVEKSYENSGERAYQAGIWSVELCKALEKRFKVEYLQNTMIKETTSGKFSRNKRKAKLFNLDSNERKEFIKLILKKKLNLIGQSDNKILACIFHRVEQKNPNLCPVLRLQDPIFPVHSQVLDLIEQVALSPTDFSEQCIYALSNVMKWPLNPKTLLQLVKLGKIYKGEGVTVRQVKRVFKTSNMGEKFIRYNEEEKSRELLDDYIDSKTCSSYDENIQTDCPAPSIINTVGKHNYLPKHEWVACNLISIKL